MQHAAISEIITTLDFIPQGAESQHTVSAPFYRGKLVCGSRLSACSLKSIKGGGQGLWSPARVCLFQFRAFCTACREMMTCMRHMMSGTEVPTLCKGRKTGGACSNPNWAPTLVHHIHCTLVHRIDCPTVESFTPGLDTCGQRCIRISIEHYYDPPSN